MEARGVTVEAAHPIEVPVQTHYSSSFLPPPASCTNADCVEGDAPPRGDAWVLEDTTPSSSPPPPLDASGVSGSSPLPHSVLTETDVDTPSSTFEAVICVELQRLLEHCEGMWSTTMQLRRVAVRSIVMDQNYAIAVTCVMLFVSCVLYPKVQTFLCTALFLVLYGMCIALQGYHFYARVTEMKYRTASVTAEVLARWRRRVDEMPQRRSQSAEERRRIFIASFAQLPAIAFRMVAVVDERTDRLKHIHKSLMVRGSKRLDEVTLKVRTYLEPVSICKLLDVMRITLESDAIVLKPLTDRARPPRLPNLMLSNKPFIEDEDTTDDSDNEHESRTALGGGNTISVSHHMEYFVHRVFLLAWALGMVLTIGTGILFYFVVRAPLGEGVFLDPAVALLGLLPLNAIVLNRVLIFYANVYLDKLFHYMVSRRSYALDDRLPRFSLWSTLRTMARVVCHRPPPNGGRNPLVFATSLVDVFGMATVVAMLDQTGIVTDMVLLPRQVLLLRRDTQQPSSSSSEESDTDGAAPSPATAGIPSAVGNWFEASPLSSPPPPPPMERATRERHRDMRRQIRRKKYQERRFLELRLAQSFRQELGVEFTEDEKGRQKHATHLNPLCLCILVHALAKEPVELATWAEPFHFCDRSLLWSRALHWIPRACGFHDGVARHFLVLARVLVIDTESERTYRDAFPQQACSYLVEDGEGALHVFTVGTPSLVCRHSTTHWTGTNVEEFDERDKREVRYMGKHQWEEGQSLETVALAHRILPERYRRFVDALPRHANRYKEYFFRNGAEVNAVVAAADQARRRSRQQERWRQQQELRRRRARRASAREEEDGEGGTGVSINEGQRTSDRTAISNGSAPYPREATVRGAPAKDGEEDREEVDGPFGASLHARHQSETVAYTSDREDSWTRNVTGSSSRMPHPLNSPSEEGEELLDDYTSDSVGHCGGSGRTLGANRPHSRRGHQRHRSRSLPPTRVCRVPAMKARSRSAGELPSDTVGVLEADDCLTANTFIQLMATTSHTFLGLVGLQDSIRPNVQSTMALLDGAGVRCMYFSSGNERQTKSFGSRIGLETDWNCCISLKEDAVALDPHSIRAQLPFGIKSIRKHILHVDPIPLQVSLFSHALGVSKRAMVSVLQDNHEVVVAVGSVFNHSNVRTFVQADLSIGVLPTRRGPNAEKDGTLKHSRIEEPSDFAAAQSFNRDLPLYRNVAELLGCSCSLRAPPTTSMLPIVAMMIRQARLRLSGIANGVEFVMHANFFLVMVNTVALIAGAPLLLTPSVTVLELCVEIPIMAMCCTYTAFAGMDPMRVMPSRHNHFVRRAIFQHSAVVWCLRYLLSVIALVALGISAATHLCHESVLSLIQVDEHVCMAAGQGYVALTFNYWLMVHCWTHISRHHPISPTLSLKLAHGRRSTYLFRSFRWLMTSFAVTLLSVVVVILDTPTEVLGLAFFPSVPHFLISLLYPALILGLDWTIKRWRELRFNNMQKFRKLTYGTRLGMHSPRGDYEPEGVTYTNPAGAGSHGEMAEGDISIPESVSVLKRISESFYRFTSMRGGKLELNCVCCDHIGGNYASYHTVANI